MTDDAPRRKRLTPKEKMRIAREERERPLTREREDILRKQIQHRMNSWPESRARAKAERKDALRFIDELLQRLAVYERQGYDNLISEHVRRDLVYDIKRYLKLEEPCPGS